MVTLIRTWPALCALGAGLVHLAVASSFTPWIVAVVIVLGLAELGWAVTALALQRPPAPRLTLAITLSPTAAVGLWALISVSAQHDEMTMRMPMTATGGMVLPLGAAAILDLVVALACASALRHVPRSESAPRISKSLAGIVLGAALVTGVTVPALAATNAGQHANTHMHM
ncbi:hypothetical protein HII28_06800 [Planctomonas sp. JC2975]|uniref:hypothetical protein n=1 Tax=Planctomonas sp. JC2975 TaxID=2729626 RepID=UPI0014760CD1|nr:hypothetical protein [Planctomonas sp. JC2975]NNC11585.1 hypothetical protein [Planctomonas sp. JC2975]